MNVLFNNVSRIVLVSAFSLLLVSAAIGQSHDDQQVSETVAAAAKAKTPAVAGAPVPVVSDVKGISIGMTADEVKKALGDPQLDDATSMYFELKNGESLQLQLGDDKKVTVISAMYSGKDAKAPEITAILGPDVKAEPGENGRIYKLVRYPSAGFWIAYSRINSGSSPITSVTIQKLN
ncbi:MAG TPA: hypothetical protein VK468_10810 [Pyrinomonadaceae bacterium]|nr:hypothetical protein [Pyrinomonadaceae bacterium]